MSQQSQFRSSYPWKKARKVARNAAGLRCQRCGGSPGKGLLHVHHRRKLRLAPGLALEPMNFAVLCGRCHSEIEPPKGRQRFAVDITGQPIGNHPWNLAGGRSDK